MDNIQSQIGTYNKELDFYQRKKLNVLPSTRVRVVVICNMWTAPKPMQVVKQVYFKCKCKCFIQEI